MTDAFETLHGYYIEELKPGMSAALSKVFVEADVAAYAELSLDDNPLHLDEAFAVRTRTGGRILHGMVTASLISAIIGTRLPGPGSLWMAQDMRFLQPVRVGETVQADATVTEVDTKRQRVILATTCRVAGRTVLEGRATVWVPSRHEEQGGPSS